MRATDFLALARDAIYAHPGSPYRKLLELAGCEYGDLDGLVKQEGVEAALQILLRQGVYLTMEEFKGRRPTVRGSTTIRFGPSQFRNPLGKAHFWSQSGGTSGVPSQGTFEFAHVRDRAVNQVLALDANGGLDWVHASWMAPGSWAIKYLLQLATFGVVPARWFSQVALAAPGLHPRYRWSALALRWGGMIAGRHFPTPEHVGIEDPVRIAHWMADVLRAGGTPHLYTFASSGVRLCQAAIAAGIDLSGAQLTIGAEPITVARLATIRRTGANVVASYGSEETGAIGRGCLTPAEPDEVHLLHDLNAIVQPGPATRAELRPNTLLFSSLRRTAAFVLINVSMGDQALMSRRSCGCPLQDLGWTTHLREIRSYEKLTTAGMTFLDTDVIGALEEALPARFGGGPTDYQLVEGEAEDGRSRLRLLVHPRLGPLNERALTEAFLKAVGVGGGAEHLATLLWREADMVRVERQPPIATALGKILHVYKGRSRAQSLA